ncbi:hypothetical protein ACFL3A_04340 [Pseudomonadota bacterium]
MRTVFGKTLTILLLPVYAASVEAAQWKIDPTLSLKAGYSDNIRQTIDDKISSAEATFSPSSRFSVETAESGLSGDLRFDFRRFEEDSNLDDNNARFLIDSFHRMERSEIGLDIGLIKDTTLDSQLENTGLIFNRETRYTVYAGPNWAYNLDERTTADFSYQYRDVQYDNNDDNGFVDFNTHNGQASLSRIVNDRTTASAIISYSLSNNDNDVETNNTNVQAGASYQFSETLSTSMFAGVRHTEADFSQDSLIPIFSGDTIIGFVPLSQDVSRSDWGYTFNGRLTKTFLRGQTSLSASRNISNDVNGVPIEVTQANWNNLYRFTEILSANLNIGVYNSQSSNSAGSKLSRDYYTIEPGFNWDFKQFWRISGSYRYSKQTFDNTSDDATQNAAYLTLTYQWPRIAVSR